MLLKCDWVIKKQVFEQKFELSSNFRYNQMHNNNYNDLGHNLLCYLSLIKRRSSATAQH